MDCKVCKTHTIYYLLAHLVIAGLAYFVIKHTVECRQRGAGGFNRTLSGPAALHSFRGGASREGIDNPESWKDRYFVW